MPKSNNSIAASRTTEIPSWIILIGALALSILVWFLWLRVGVGFVHASVATYAETLVKRPAAAASSPNAASSTLATTYQDRAGVMAEAGQAGDAFGAANALFAAIAGALVLWAGVLQSRALKEAKLATRVAADAYKEERAANKREQFISTFFQMLTLNRQLVERIEISSDSQSAKRGPRKGAAALESLAWTLVSRLENQQIDEWETQHQASALATTYIGSVYDTLPSALGPYFRLLFQTFKFVADAEIEEDERIRFANIARGQISEGAVMLLAANGLTERGHRFIPLIERFGLLEHLHKDYRNKFKRVLLEGYRPRAFLGSEEREKHALEPKPLHPAHHFLT